jgi:hypothetical protein
VNRVSCLIVICLLSVSPSLSADQSVVIDNRSSLDVSFGSVFPINDRGEPVEDNLGGIGPVASGTSATFPIDSTQCERLLIVVTLADQSELRADVDTCKGNTIVVSD